MPLTIVVNLSFLDVYGSPKYASEYLLRNRVWPYCNLSYLIPLTNRISLLRPFSLRIGFKRAMYDACNITSSSVMNKFFNESHYRHIKRICSWHDKFIILWTRSRQTKNVLQIWGLQPFSFFRSTIISKICLRDNAIQCRVSINFFAIRIYLLYLLYSDLYFDSCNI